MTEKIGSIHLKKKSRFPLNLILAILGAFLFAASHPNILFTSGLSFLGYIALIPLFLLIKRIYIKTSFVWGGFTGVCLYFLFNFWIIFFHPAAIYIIIAYYFIVYSLLFLVLKIIDLSFPKYGFIFEAIAWVAFEYIKTLMFMGYPYGILGYTQWKFPLLIRSASIFGVWGISLILVFFSSLCAEIILKCMQGGNFRSIFALYGKYAAAWLGCFFALIAYGLYAKQDYSAAEFKKIALIQPNTDPWIGNIEVYKRNFYTLKTLSENAISEHKDISLVVWPETAFIPRIRWHYKYANDVEAAVLVRELLEFLNKQQVPFLIGNDDAVFKENTGKGSSSGRVDYNAALLFIPQQNVIPPEPATYRKMHLVPFTEHFPYKHIFPRIYAYLNENNTHFWEKGEERTVFDVNGMKFGTPICFEDCFGYISADFVKKGARLIVNITNDAWAQSLVCQNQHLSMAVFRAVENRVPLVRAASSGQTAYIDPNGSIKAELTPFVSGFLIAEVPLLTERHKTVYSFAGDFFAQTALVLMFAVLCAAGVRFFKIGIGKRS